MKSLYLLPSVVISLAICLAGYFIGNMHKQGKKYDRHVAVKGLSEREVPADLAVWPMTIALAGNDLQSLERDIEFQNREVYQFFIKQGFKESEITRGVLNITDAYANLYGSSGQRPEYRYQGNSEFTVRTTEIDKLQKALTASPELLSKGILLGSKNNWRPIEYLFTDLNEIKPAMIEEATRNAREVAERFAQDSRSEVGDILIARQGLFTIEDRDQSTPQIKTVRVVSTIDFQLTD
jgi:hypothetical protein